MFKREDDAIYDTDKLAEYILRRCTKAGMPITNTRLNEILYFIQQAFLDCGLLAFDDDFETRECGAVIPRIYDKYISSNGPPIRQETGPRFMDMMVIDLIIDEWKDAEPWKSENRIKKKGSAYQMIYLAGLGEGKIIKRKLIQKFGW